MSAFRSSARRVGFGCIRPDGEDVRCDVGTTSSYDLSGLNNSFPITKVRFVNVTMGNNGTVGVPMKEAGCSAIECTCDALTSPCPRCCTKSSTES